MGSFTGIQPNDAALIPISSVYSPQNNTFPATQGADGAYVDQFSNASTAPVISFIQPRIVQRAIAVTGSGAKSLSCSLPNPVMGGNSIVVCLGTGDTEDIYTGFVVTDLQQNQYMKAVSTPQGASLEAAIYFTTGIKPGQNTVTFAITGPTAVPTGISMKIYEVWGLISSIDALDQIAAGNGASGTTIRPGGLIPTTPNQMAFTSLVAGKIVTITPPASFSTNDGTLFPWGGQIGAFDSQYRPLSNFITLDVQASFSLPSPWAMAIATFRSIVLPVQGTFNMAPATNAIITSVTSSANSVQFLTPNSTRRGVSVFNESTSVLYLTFGPITAKSYYTTQIPPGGLYEMPQPLYIGAVSGLWAAANGFARVTEMI